MSTQKHTNNTTAEELNRPTNIIEIEIATNMNIPTTETGESDLNKEQEKSENEPEGRELRRRRKRDYNRLNTVGTSESEEIPQQATKEKAPKTKTPKMKLDEAHRKIAELLDTVAMMEQENKEGLETNRALKNDIDIKDHIIKDMETTIMDKSNKIKEIEHTLQRQTEAYQKQTKEKEHKPLLVLADSNREPVIAELKKMRPKWNIEAPSTIYTTDHLIRHLEQHPLPTNTTNIIMMGTNDIRKNMNSEAIKNIPKIQKHINDSTIVSNIPPTNIDLGNEEVNEEIIEARITYNKHINNTFKRTIKTSELNKAMRTDPSTILKSDGFHLTANGAKQLATAWIRAVEEPTEITQKQQDYITIDVKYARHIIGKEGKNLKTLKDKHNITITTNNDTNNNLILTATGNPNNIQKALTEIRTIIEIQQESDKELENKKSKYNGKQCRDYKSTGYCARGRSCWFSHEQENQTPTTTTTTTTYRRDERNQQTPTTSTTHRFDGRDNSRTRTEYQEKRRGDRFNRTPEREDTHQKRRREQSRNRQVSRNRQEQRTRSPEFMYRDYRYKDTQQDRSRGRDRRWSPTRH